MPNDFYSDSHAIVPVRDPNSGNIMTVAVPHDTSLGDLHAALEPYYHDPAALSVQGQPTAEGALENSPAFQDAAAKAIESAGAKGTTSFEGRMIVNKQGQPTVLKPSQEAYAGTMPITSNTFATLHSHPENEHADPHPSAADIQSAKDAKVPFYVATSRSLYYVRPTDGKVIPVFENQNWTQPKQEQVVNGGINPSHFAIQVELKNGRKVWVDGGDKYPMDQMGTIRKDGGKDFSNKDVKNVIAFPPEEK